VAVTWQQGWDFAIPMSPHCPAIFLQHSRSAAVIDALGNAHAITGNAANNTAKTRTQALRMSVNRLIVAATVN
jgi:hypothetical protein